MVNVGLFFGRHYGSLVETATNLLYEFAVLSWLSILALVCIDVQGLKLLIDLVPFCCFGPLPCCIKAVWKCSPMLVIFPID